MLAVAIHLYLRARLLALLHVVPERAAATVQGHATRTVDTPVATRVVKRATVYIPNSVQLQLRMESVNFTMAHQEVIVSTRRKPVVVGQTFWAGFRDQGLPL